jgi:hypothetical protein
MACTHNATAQVCRKCGVALLGFFVRSGGLKVKSQKEQLFLAKKNGGKRDRCPT